MPLRSLVLILLLALHSALVAGEGPFLSVDEIKPGMKGYGKTVFLGDTVERFDAEIISVMKNYSPKGDMILARLSGGPLKESGLIAGMSGSPVYINDKLIGAVAYGWTFAKEPIAGITPIEEMARVAQETSDKGERTKADLGPSPWNPNGGRGTGDEGREHGSPSSHVPRPTSLSPRLPVPVMVSCSSPATLRLLQPTLEQFNLFPVASGAPAGTSTKKVTFEAGAPLGVQLVRGDVDMVAVGTLTYREGEKILAFGHPMFQSGETDMPMVAAYVHTVVASQERSFKLAGTAAQVGRITEDRRAAIAGEMGRFAKMIPCVVSVDSAPSRGGSAPGGRSGRKHSYHYEVISQRLLTPALVESIAMDSVGATEGVTGDYMMNLHTEMRLSGRPQPIVSDNLYYESGGFGMGLMEIAQETALLMNNPFEPVRIEGFDIKATVQPGRHTASIDGVTADNRFVKAGDKVRLTVNLKPYDSGKLALNGIRSGLVAVPFEVELPSSLPVGRSLTVIVSDAMTSRMMERMTNPGAFRPENLAQLIALMEREYDNRDLVFRIALPTVGVSLHGETLPGLPRSLMTILAFGNQSSAMPAMNEIVRKHRTEWVLSGSQSLSLIVEQER